MSKHISYIPVLVSFNNGETQYITLLYPSLSLLSAGSWNQKLSSFFFGMWKKMFLCVYSKELRQVKDFVQHVFWYTFYFFNNKKNTPDKNYEIGTVKIHFKENMLMRVEIQYIKDNFYFSTKGRLFFISSSLYLLLL